MTQTQCIANTTAASGDAPNTYAQEYLAYMQELREKVQNKTFSENEARTKLGNKLTGLRSLQQNELMIQEQLENQGAEQTTQILMQNKPIQLEVPRTPPLILAPTIRTNCHASGSQVNCTSR